MGLQALLNIVQASNVTSGTSQPNAGQDHSMNADHSVQLAAVALEQLSQQKTRVLDATARNLSSNFIPMTEMLKHVRASIKHPPYAYFFLDSVRI